MCVKMKIVLIIRFV